MSSPKLSIVSGLRRSSRRESGQTTDDAKNGPALPWSKSKGGSSSSVLSGRGFIVKNENSKVHPHSKFASHEFCDPACPFDVDGFCVMHPDVRMAKKKSKGWKIIAEECPKCIDLSLKLKGTDPSAGDTESMTSEPTQDSFDPKDVPQSNSTRRIQSNLRSSGNSLHSYTQSNQPSRPRRLERNTDLCRRSSRSISPEINTNHRRRSKKTRSRSPSNDCRVPDRRIGSQSDDYSLVSEGPERGEYKCDNDNKDGIRGANRRTGRKQTTRSKSPWHADRRPQESSRNKRASFVDGAPFDKNGCCVVHSHIKLASKKMLGGWKIHMEFCPACANNISDEGSVKSGVTHASGVSNISGRSRRSTTSAKSVTSWTSNRSTKKATDASSPPHDVDGFCLHHPDVQLARLNKRGDWRVLLDFCPECAGDSLMIGGALIRDPNETRERWPGDSTSVSSAKSAESDSIRSLFVEKMPFIDDEGKPGHYTGHVNEEGKPCGRGKIKYVDGGKFDGVWDEGSKIHGRESSSKRKGRRTHSSSLNSLHHSQPCVSQLKNARPKSNRSDVANDMRSHRYSCSDVPSARSRMPREDQTIDLHRRKSHDTGYERVTRRQSHRSRSRIRLSRASTQRD